MCKLACWSVFFYFQSIFLNVFCIISNNESFFLLSLVLLRLKQSDPFLSLWHAHTHTPTHTHSHTNLPTKIRIFLFQRKEMRDFYLSSTFSPLQLMSVRLVQCLFVCLWKSENCKIGFHSFFAKTTHLVASLWLCLIMAHLRKTILNGLSPTQIM